jgi:hypothetical protein
MALFAALIEFTGDEELRLQTRPVHREYLRTLLEVGRRHWGADHLRGGEYGRGGAQPRRGSVPERWGDRERHIERVAGSVEVAGAKRRPMTSSATQVGSPARFAR